MAHGTTEIRDTCAQIPLRYEARLGGLRASFDELPPSVYDVPMAQRVYTLDQAPANSMLSPVRREMVGGTARLVCTRLLRVPREEDVVPDDNEAAVPDSDPYWDHFCPGHHSIRCKPVESGHDRLGVGRSAVQSRNNTPWALIRRAMGDYRKYVQQKVVSACPCISGSSVLNLQLSVVRV